MVSRLCKNCEFTASTFFVKSLDDSLIHFEQEISRFLPAFLKSKEEKKTEFLQFRGGLIPDSFIVFSRWILNDYNSIITIIIDLYSFYPQAFFFNCLLTLVLNNNYNSRKPLFSTSTLQNLPILGNFKFNIEVLLPLIS